MKRAATTHLIIVCCHAVYAGGPSHGLSEKEWLIQSFQKDETPTFIAHAQTGLRLLAASPEDSMLVFSGSKTKVEVEKSEARGYRDLCEEHGFWGILDGRLGLGVEERVVVEEQALDSFSNLVYSIILFWKKIGNWPRKISLVSHGFKKERFMKLHFPAMRFPVSRVDFVGIDPEYMVEGSREFDRMRAEAVRKDSNQRGYREWEVDRLGVGESLRGKRERRNPWGVGQEFFESREERERSRIKSEVVEWVDERGTVVREEVLKDERQPWEDEESV